METGQGITTSTAMLIAEELELPVEKVHVTLADARPELLFNQVTYGSNTTISTYTPFRVAAAIARRALLDAAAVELGDTVANLRAKAGHVFDSTGHSVSYGELATKAASATTRRVAVPRLKPQEQFSVIGKPQNRVDAGAAVTGQKSYTLDLDIPDAWPTMICRAPTINGTVKRVNNAPQVAKMPGITDVVTIPTGVAVRGRTFGQCIDAIRELDVDWGPGTVEGESDETILARLRRAELPLAVPRLPLLARTIEQEFVFSWKSNSALEPQTAIADVRDGHAEIWSSMQAPILTSEAARLPPLGQGNELEYSQTVFETTTNVPYDFGVTTQLLNEVLQYDTFPTGSNRNLYNPDVVTAVELMVDRLAKAMHKDPYRFRRSFLKDDRARAVLDAVAGKGSW